LLPAVDLTRGHPHRRTVEGEVVVLVRDVEVVEAVAAEVRAHLVAAVERLPFRRDHDDVVGEQVAELVEVAMRDRFLPPLRQRNHETRSRSASARTSTLSTV